jgi:hypothetical protein
MGKLIYHSADGHARRTLHTDESGFTQETSIVYPDDFEQRNRELGETQQGHMKLVARGVPLFVWEQSEREGWDEKRWAQWLNDPDNRAFRVWQGAV